jgi:hypothetical protein
MPEFTLISLLERYLWFESATPDWNNMTSLLTIDGKMKKKKKGVNLRTWCLDRWRIQESPWFWSRPSCSSANSEPDPWLDCQLQNPNFSEIAFRLENCTKKDV